MSLLTDLQAKQTAAMKAGDKDVLSTLRMLTAAIKNEQIATQKELTDEDVTAIIAKQVKQLQDALNDFVAGGRDDLKEKTEKEIALLRDYLPAQLSDEELTAIVTRVVSETRATSAADMGKVMGMVMKEVKGQADGNRVRTIVSKQLS